MKIPINRLNEACEMFAKCTPYELSTLQFEIWCTSSDIKEMVTDWAEKEEKRIEDWSFEECQFVLGLQEWLESL
jgi:hypothetical protein